MNVFDGGQEWRGSFKADSLKFNIGGQQIAGAMVQGINYQFNQQLNQMFELGSNYVYFIGGRAQGQLNLQKISTAPALNGLLLANFNDICKPNDLELSADTQNCFDGGSTYSWSAKFLQCVLQGVSGGSNANDVVVNGSAVMQFVDMELSNL